MTPLGTYTVSGTKWVAGGVHKVFDLSTQSLEPLDATYGILYNTCVSKEEPDMPTREKTLADFDFTEDVIPLSEFRGTIADCILKTRRTHRPILVTQNGRAASFFVDVADFQKMRETIAIMDDVRAAEEEIERGETFPAEELRARLHAERNVSRAARSLP